MYDCVYAVDVRNLARFYDDPELKREDVESSVEVDDRRSVIVIDMQEE